MHLLCHDEQVLAKAEMLNPGGSVKDRVALQVIQEALADGRLAPGGLITEGTAGSTGVSLAMVRDRPLPPGKRGGCARGGCA